MLASQNGKISPRNRGENIKQLKPPARKYTCAKIEYRKGIYSSLWKKEMDRHFNILTNTDFKMYEYSLFQSRLSGKQDSQKMVTWKKNISSSTHMSEPF